MRDRRLAWAQHRREMTRLILAKADWVPVLIFASLLLTPEARLDVGGLQLYPYRLALFAALPAMIIRAGRNPIKFGVLDFLMVASAVLMFFSTSAHYEVDVALKSGGANMADMLLAYFAGRIFFRSSLDVRRFLYRIIPILAVIALIMVAESVSHRYILRPFVGKLTGHSPGAILSKMFEIRNGFLRATGPFLHPIGAGLFFGTLAPLYMTADLPKRRWLGLASCFGGVFGWSSAGIAALAAGIALTLYEFAQKRLRLGWLPVIGTVVVGAVLVEALTNSGLIRFIIRFGAINPITGYFRLAIFEYGSAALMKSPWLGIGLFESYERPVWMRTDSVDNYWLLHAMRYGLPSMLMMLAGALGIVFKLGFSKQGVEHGSLYGRRLASGICIALIVNYFSIISVAPWGADLAWTLILTGAAAGLADRKPSLRVGTRAAT